VGCKGGNFLIFPFPFIVTVRAIMSEVYFVAIDKNVPFIDMLRILTERVGIGNGTELLL
jgi:hypothetical protein